MLRTIISGAFLAAVLGHAAIAAETLIPLDFQVADQSSAETLSLWPEYEEQLRSPSPYQNVFTAKLKTPEGDELVISQMNSPYACGDQECPVKVQRNGVTEYDNGACRYTEQFFLNESMNTLFMCDDAVPTVTLGKK